MAQIEVVDNRVVAGDAMGKEGSGYYTFPTLEKLSDGSYLVCALEGTEKSGPDGRIKAYRSTDGGCTWTEASSPASADESDSGYGYMMCHVKEIGPRHVLAAYARVRRVVPGEPLFHPETNGIQFSEVRLVRSEDNGRTWGAPYTLDYRLPDMIIPGKLIALPDGALGMTCEVWHEWDKGFREGPSSRLILSHDQGHTWPEAAMMAKDPNGASIFGDPRLTVNEYGKWIALFWRYSLLSGEDMPVHRAESGDEGRTWSEPHDTGLRGQIASPLSLGEGRMLCVFQERFGSPGLKAMFSRDEGMTWEADSVTTLWGSAADTENRNPFSGYEQYTFGYSSIVGVDERTALVPFWCSNGRTTCIRMLKLNVSQW